MKSFACIWVSWNQSFVSCFCKINLFSACTVTVYFIKPHEEHKQLFGFLSDQMCPRLLFISLPFCCHEHNKMNIAMLSGIEILHNHPGFSLLVWSIDIFEADALVY